MACASPSLSDRYKKSEGVRCLYNKKVPSETEYSTYVNWLLEDTETKFGESLRVAVVDRNLLVTGVQVNPVSATLMYINYCNSLPYVEKAVHTPRTLGGVTIIFKFRAVPDTLREIVKLGLLLIFAYVLYLILSRVP